MLLQKVCSDALDLLTCNFTLGDGSTMLTGAALQTLVLAAVCLSSWAVPLRSITSSEEDRRTESNTPSPSLDPPEVSSEGSLSSSVHEGLGSVMAVDDEERTLRWDSSYHTRTADAQQNKTLPEESLLSAAADIITENSPSSDPPPETTDDIQPERPHESTPEPEEDTRLHVSGGSTVRLLTSACELHQSLKSTALDVTDVWTEALHLQTGQ